VELQVRSDGALLYEILPLEFPERSTPVLVVEDLPPRDGASFGALGRIWAARGDRLKAYPRSALDADALAQLDRALDALRRDARRAFDLRAAERASDGSRAAFDRMNKLRRELRKVATAREDLADALADLADRLAPVAGEPAGTLADALEPLAAATAAAAIPASTAPASAIPAAADATGSAAAAPPSGSR
jgi:hypothetical protein